MLKDEKDILLNTEEAARQLGLTPKTLRRWHSEARGELIALQPGGPGAMLYWRLADVQALAKIRTHTANVSALRRKLDIAKIHLDAANEELACVSDPAVVYFAPINQLNIATRSVRAATEAVIDMLEVIK